VSFIPQYEHVFSSIYIGGSCNFETVPPQGKICDCDILSEEMGLKGMKGIHTNNNFMKNERSKEIIGH
jgi:hypothetical protein